MTETSATAAALAIRGVTVRAGDATLLDDATIDIGRGRIVAVIGPNGAGKTTLLDAISGMVSYEGQIDIGGSTAYRLGQPRAGVGRVFQGSPLPETLTVGEVVALVAGGRSAAEPILARFGLAPHATSFVAELSTGMRRILDLAIATIANPGVLLLDEPASGLAQSEVEHLAALVKRYRDATGCAIIVVEHDAWLVKAIADEVLALEGGRIVAHGPAAKVLAKPRKGVRLHSAQEEEFRSALGRITSEAEAPPGLPRRTLSRWTLLRLGLREMSGGMAAVLLLNILTRSLHLELKISLALATAIVACTNLAAPLALAIGHRSDTRPIFGRRRTPYIIGGAIVTGLALAAAPYVTKQLAHGVTFFLVIECVALFVAMGIGQYGAGTVFFALLSDRTGPADRGHAAMVVYMELMVGILAGVVLADATTSNHGRNLGTLFGLAGALVVLLSTVAVWGQDRKLSPQEIEDVQTRRVSAEHVSFRKSLQSISSIPQARLFFWFMVVSSLFILLQQAVLSSFGGEALKLSLHATGGFSAMMTVGTIAGMVVAGRPFAEQFGFKRVAITGLAISVVTFITLSISAAAISPPLAWLSILIGGFGGGLFNVSTLALMMTMADRKRTALFMGAWTLAHALADGSASAGGGSVYTVARHLFHSVSGGYAAVFALEAIGLAICIPLIKRIDPGKFMAELSDPADAFIAALPDATGELATEALADVFPAEPESEIPVATNGSTTKKPPARKKPAAAAKKKSSRGSRA